MLDDTDLTILSMLEENARVPHAEIARRVGMAPSAIHERIRKLEERGVVQAYEARLDPNALGRDLLAFVLVSKRCGTEHASPVDELAAIEGVQELHVIAGEHCYLLKVRAASMADLHDIINDRIPSVASVDSTKTIIALKTVKETTRILPERDEDGERRTA